MRKIIVAVAVACALGAYAEERTVSTAQGLFEALQALNGTGGTVYLETGDYDVGPYDYGGYWSSATKFVTTNGFCHLALNNVTLIGKSDNPRDTVIYGNRTSGIIYSYIGKMSNLTISNGYFSADRSYGAGVYATGTGSIFSNMVVTCCVNASPKKGNGGGVYDGTWYDSTIISNAVVKNGGGGICTGVMYNCNIISNYAGGTGGGCYYGSKLHDCRVIGNRAGTGGGVATSDGGSACKVYGGVIAGNHAATGGGAANTVFFYGGTVVSNNVATGTGGGLYLGKSGTANPGFASNSVICCNTAVTGGGCANGTVVGCEIFGNTASVNGGGVAGSICESCTIKDNVAAQYGGGCRGGSYTNCVVKSNVSSLYGGGCSGGWYTNCVVTGNSAVQGGGAYWGWYHDCAITNNVASSYGGGTYTTTNYSCLVACNAVTGSPVYAYGGGMYGGTGYDCVISNNTVEATGVGKSASASGAGTSGSELFDSIVIHNFNKGSLTNAYGGGMHNGSASNTLICGNAVYSKVSTTIVGGGTVNVELRDCKVINNFVRGSLGCGVNGGKLYNCVVSNNSSASSSSYAVRQVSWLENCDVVGCVYTYRALNSRFVNFTNGVFWAEGENVYTNGYLPSGSGVNSYMINAYMYATNCLIANNTFPGAMFDGGTSEKPEVLSSCTIADNVCEKMFISTSTEGATEVVNCIFAGNRNASGEARNLWYTSDAYNKIRLQNCLIGSGRNPAVAPPYEEVNTVTNDNAKFVKDGSRDAYALKRSSPAIGKGLIQDWMTDALDIRKDPAFPRLRDGAVDIGCYQCWLDPVGLWFSIR